MDAPQSSGPSAAVKRPRTVRFPCGFEKHVLRSCARRSAFIRARLESVGEDGCIDLPEEECSLWLECMMLTMEDLQAEASFKLVQYVKATEFFQDVYLVKQLCDVLGRRLLKPLVVSSTAPAEGSTAPQLSCHKENPSEVLESLSHDHAIEVLRSSPASLAEKFIQLPSQTHSAAAMAHVPGLTAVCFPAEVSSTSSSPEQPVLEVCVDTTQAQADSGIVHDCLPAAGSSASTSWETCVAGASMWPAKSAKANISLERRAGSIAIGLFARSSTLSHHTIVLPDSACLVFGPTCGSMHLKDIIFRGGLVVCMGGGCSVTFDDVRFERCTLVVRSGAHATLNRVQFREMDSSAADISVCVHGAGTKVVVNGGTVSGGRQGVTLQAGAHLEASDLTITGVGKVGVDCRDEGSSLKLCSCCFYDSQAGIGVHVCERSTAHLSRLYITGVISGVCEETHASAKLLDCLVYDTARSCVVFGGGTTGRLDSCTLSGPQCHGLQVGGSGACIHASQCNFLDSARFAGAAAVNGGVLTAEGCASSGNTRAGYLVQGAGSRMDLLECTSTADRMCGCEANTQGELTARKVVISGCQGGGCLVHKGGIAVLQQCTAKNCGRQGVLAGGASSRLELHDCEIHHNSHCGVAATRDAVVEVRRCRSSGNRGHACYWAQKGGHITVSNSSSDGDYLGCGVCPGVEVLPMEGVVLDGESESEGMLS